MIIQRLEISNFRSLKEVDIECDSLLAILGRNGTGKSSILHALDSFYNVSAQFTEYDYFDKDASSEITIRVTYGNLKEDEQKEFSSYLTDDKLVVTKVINSGGAKYFGAHRQLPDFNELRKQAANPKRKGFNELVDSGKYPDLSAKVTTGAGADEAMLAFENAHPDLLEVFQMETQFFGPRNVGGGKLDNYTKFVLIPAVRDASAEAEKRGTIIQLIDVLVMRSVNAREDVKELNAEFEKRVKEVYNEGNLTELRSLATMISDVLKKYAPGAELDLSFGDIIPPKLNLPPTIASLVEDNFKCPINYSGHGLQRALIFALLQQLSITLGAQVKESEENLPEEITPDISKIPDLILAIEEPELYLHPARCRYLSKVMFDLSLVPENLTDPKTQVIYGTHSAYFIDLQRFNQIKLARKVLTDGTSTLQTKLTSFSKSDAAEKLAEVSLRTPDEFNEITFTAHASPVMTTIVNEGFFADVVVVVEGLSDVAALWTMQEILGQNWDALGIAIVPAVGKNNIDRPVVIFRGLEIPTYFLFDADSDHKGSDKETKTIASNKLLLRLAGAEVQDFPDTNAFDTWAVFNDELESELKQSLGDNDFNRIRQTTADHLGYTQPSKVLKNPEGVSEFIHLVYSEGKHITILENVISKITDLRNGNS